MYTAVEEDDAYRKDFSGFCGDKFTTIVTPLFVNYLFKCYCAYIRNSSWTGTDCLNGHTAVKECQARSLLPAEDLSTEMTWQDTSAYTMHEVPDRSDSGLENVDANCSTQGMHVSPPPSPSPLPLRQAVVTNTSPSSSRTLGLTYPRSSIFSSPPRAGLPFEQPAPLNTSQMLMLSDSPATQGGLTSAPLDRLQAPSGSTDSEARP